MSFLRVQEAYILTILRNIYFLFIISHITDEDIFLSCGQIWLSREFTCELETGLYVIASHAIFPICISLSD